MAVTVSLYCCIDFTHFKKAMQRNSCVQQKTDDTHWILSESNTKLIPTLRSHEEKAKPIMLRNHWVNFSANTTNVTILTLLKKL